MGFHPSKARLPGQFPVVTLSPSRGALQIEAYLGASKWPQQKKGNRWIVADYASLLEQAASADLHEARPVSAATGRVHAALDLGQMHFDTMEEGHRRILAQVVTIILYKRYCVGTSLFNDREQSEAL